MEATHLEKEISKVLCFLDELDGQPLDRRHGMLGYHDKVYNMGLSRDEADEYTEKLCSRLQKEDVTKYSLEMQIWWRDHQDADKARIAGELRAKRNTSERQAAIAKLTLYERELLGIK
jgi:hypothetical protein